MKTIKLSAAMTAILFGLSINTASAKSWRVNHDLSTGANFASIDDAMSAKDTDNNDMVVAGDTLYLDPGLITSATATINKCVTIIGTGYLRTSSPHQFAKISHTLTITAEGTKIEGVHINTTLNLNAANITIERCYIVGRITSSSNKCKEHTGITIRQCYFSTYWNSGSTYNAIVGNSSSQPFTNAVIENNNIIIGGNYGGSPLRYLQSCTIRNNYILYGGTKNDQYVLQNVTNSSIYNNVLLNKATPEQILSSVSITPHHNIYSSSPIASNEESADPIRVDDNNNYRLGSASESEIFAMSGNDDARYSELKEGSPAIGFGVDGVDCGPTGGLYPYVVSGLPAYHPYYTNAVFSKTSDGTGINVSLKIKMQNE